MMAALIRSTGHVGYFDRSSAAMPADRRAGHRGSVQLKRTWFLGARAGRCDGATGAVMLGLPTIRSNRAHRARRTYDSVLGESTGLRVSAPPNYSRPTPGKGDRRSPPRSCSTPGGVWASRGGVADWKIGKLLAGRSTGTGSRFSVRAEVKKHTDPARGLDHADLVLPWEPQRLAAAFSSRLHAHNPSGQIDGV